MKVRQTVTVGVFVLLTVFLAFLVMTALSSAQALARVATTPEALIAAPVFFHGKQVAVRRDVEPAGQLMKLAGTAKPVFVFWRDG